MFSKLHGYLRIINENGFIRACTRAMCVFSLVLILAVAASAYTVVLLGGRRVEIPERFTVTQLSLTYEAAPGINITILMSSINIPATERANNEPAGSLLKRASQAQAAKKVSGQLHRPKRELTREAIEAGRRARQKSEQDYERRRVELGLPSLEESRRRSEEETRRLRELSLQSEGEQAQAEGYWRTRARQLRTDIASLSGQINYIRARLAELPEHAYISSYAFVRGVVPGVHPHRTVTRFPVVTGNPGFMRGNSAVTPGAGFLAFGGIATQGGVRVNAAGSSGFGRRGLQRQLRIAPAITFFGTPYPDYDYAGERAGLVSRLHELEAARAGLQSRWRILEEEARRAGVPPGWLRP